MADRQLNIEDMWNSIDSPVWCQVFIFNDDSHATQVITNSADRSETDLANVVPNYAYMVGKWEDNTQANKIRFANGGSNDYASGSSITVMGTD